MTKSPRLSRAGLVVVALGEALLQQQGLDIPAGEEDLRCVWTYRDRSLEKDSRFAAKLSKSGRDKSKRIVAMGGENIFMPLGLLCMGNR
jgi:hypothetical protein